MIQRFCLCIALALLGVAHTASDALSAKPQPSTKPASAVFSDRAGDRITSDLQGAYPGEVYITGSYDFQVDVGRTDRRFNYFFQRTENGCGGTGPTGMVSDIAHMSIRKLHLVPVGATRANTASFNTSAGYFRFLGQDSLNPPHCSMRVLVQRLSATQWVVSADAGTAGEAENPAVVLNTGPFSELLRDGHPNTLEFLGNYPMPFQVTVTCPTCTP